MRGLHRLTVAVLLFGSGCSSMAGPVIPSAMTESVTASIRLETPTRCRIELDGRSVAVPGEGSALADAVASIRNRFRRIVIRAPFDIPYRCVGALLFEAQRAGILVDFAGGSGLAGMITRRYYEDGAIEIVRGHDTDGDGRLSNAEWAAMVEAGLTGSERASMMRRCARS
jgi:hypothetical protein